MSFNSNRDLLFNQEKGQEQEQQEQEQEQNQEPITAEQVALQIEAATGPIQHELALANERLLAANAMNEQLITQSRQGTPNDTGPERTSDEFVQEFTDDALTATKAVAEEAVDKRVAGLEPIFQRQNDTISKGLVDAEQRAVEAEYGAEAWALHIEPLLTVRLQALKVKDQLAMANPDVIRNEVLSIMGHKRHELAEVKVAMGVIAKEAEVARYDEIRQELNMTGMTGGTTAPTTPIDAPLNDADLDFIASKKAAGQEVDIPALRKTISSGVTGWGAWKAAQEATK